MEDNSISFQDFYNGKAGYWQYSEAEDWEAFCELHKDVIMEKLKDLYFVDIEDPFEDAYDVLDDARCDSLWTESRR